MTTIFIGKIISAIRKVIRELTVAGFPWIFITTTLVVNIVIVWGLIVLGWKTIPELYLIFAAGSIHGRYSVLVSLKILSRSRNPIRAMGEYYRIEAAEAKK